mmetsp:Transcript_18609/g.49160  ORF Transcript_18609/g.49160 Transcript_18609/m.49160 type:complete len:233 (-) Transcript_18609:14-712(-)
MPAAAGLRGPPSHLAGGRLLHDVDRVFAGRDEVLLGSRRRPRGEAPAEAQAERPAPQRDAAAQRPEKAEGDTEVLRLHGAVLGGAHGLLLVEALEQRQGSSAVRARGARGRRHERRACAGAVAGAAPAAAGPRVRVAPADALRGAAGRLAAHRRDLVAPGLPAARGAGARGRRLAAGQHALGRGDEACQHGHDALARGGGGQRRQDQQGEAAHPGGRADARWNRVCGGSART